MKDVGRVGKPTGLSQAEPQERLGPSGFDPSREWVAWLERASIAANDAWTRDRSIRIACTPNGFWVEGRQLVRELRQEVRAEQLRPYSYVARANTDTITPAVERVLEMLASAVKRARDSDESPQGRDREDGLDGEAATARAEGIAQTQSAKSRGEQG